jgi:four helix bundle protein
LRGKNPGIVVRTADFADRVIEFVLRLPNNTVGWELGRQLVGAGMSVGANVEESQAAESRPDFIHKLKIARKECREARFFLQRAVNAQLAPGRAAVDLIDEAEQILRLLTAIICSSSGNKKRPVTRNS